MGADVEKHYFWYNSGFEILPFAIYTVLLEGLFSWVLYVSERRLTHREK
jgi:hypothetical protein